VNFLQKLYKENYSRLVKEQGQNTIQSKILLNRNVQHLSLIKAALKSDEECKKDAKEIYLELSKDQKTIQNFPAIFLQGMNEKLLNQSIILGEIESEQILGEQIDLGAEISKILINEGNEVSEKLLEKGIDLSKPLIDQDVDLFELLETMVKNSVLRLISLIKAGQIEEVHQIRVLKKIIVKRLYQASILSWRDEKKQMAKQFMQESILYRRLDDFIRDKCKKDNLQIEEINLQNLKKYLLNRLLSEKSLIFKYTQSKANNRALEKLVKEYETDLSEALRLEKQQARKFYYLGVSYFVEKEYGKAFNYFQHTLKAGLTLKLDFPNREYASFFFWRGKAYQKMKKYGEAIQDFEKAIEYNSNHPQAKMILEECRTEQNQ